MELGQAIFGNATGKYETERYVDVLIDGLLEEISRVYFNNNQKEWEKDELNFDGITFRPYYWGEDIKEKSLPNLTFDFSEQEIRWYKYPGRGQTCTLKWDEKKWVEWFNKAMFIIINNVKDDFDE